MRNPKSIAQRARNYMESTIECLIMDTPEWQAASE